jgi:hypothetical protein
MIYYHVYNKSKSTIMIYYQVYNKSKSTIMIYYQVYNKSKSTIMIYYQVYNKSKTTRATIGAGTTHPTGATEFIPGFCGIRLLCFIIQIFICPFVLFLLTIVLSVLFTASNYLITLSCQRAKDVIPNLYPMVWPDKVSCRSFVVVSNHYITTKLVPIS